MNTHPTLTKQVNKEINQYNGLIKSFNPVNINHNPINNFSMVQHTPHRHNTLLKKKENKELTKKMLKILIKTPQNIKDYENPENWTEYSLLNHLHSTLTYPQEEDVKTK